MVYAGCRTVKFVVYKKLINSFLAKEKKNGKLVLLENVFMSELYLCIQCIEIVIYEVGLLHWK